MLCSISGVFTYFGKTMNTHSWTDEVIVGRKGKIHDATILTFGRVIQNWTQVAKDFDNQIKKLFILSNI